MTAKTNEDFIITGKNATDSKDSTDLLKNLLKHCIIGRPRGYGWRCSLTSAPNRSRLNASSS